MLAAPWVDDYNNFPPHSLLGYQTPADYAGIIAETGLQRYAMWKLCASANCSRRAIWLIKKTPKLYRIRLKFQRHVTGRYASRRSADWGTP